MLKNVYYKRASDENLFSLKVNREEIGTLENKMQTKDKLTHYRNSLDSYYKKSLLPKEIFINLNYSLQMGMDLLDHYHHKILICGTINSGKTSIINTLIEENLLDVSSLENSRWPIIIRKANKKYSFKKNEEQQTENSVKDNNNNFKLYSAKLVKSKYLFEFEKNKLIAEGKENVKEYLRSLNNNHYLNSSFKEFQVNYYKKKAQNNFCFDISGDDSLLNSSVIKTSQSSACINDKESPDNLIFYWKARKKNIVEKSLEQINKTLDNIDDIEIIKEVKAVNSSKSMKNQEKITNNNISDDNKNHKKIKIHLEEGINCDFNSALASDKLNFFDQHLLENFLKENESFIKYLKEKNVVDKLFVMNDRLGINQKDLREHFEEYHKLEKKKLKAMKHLKDNKYLSDPHLFDESIANYIFIMEIDFDTLNRQHISNNLFINENSLSKNFEIWDIPGLNSDKNQISNIVINNLIQNEKDINQKFNFLNERRLILLFVSECNHYNQ